VWTQETDSAGRGAVSGSEIGAACRGLLGHVARCALVLKMADPVLPLCPKVSCPRQITQPWARDWNTDQVIRHIQDGRTSM
jgi:hypothetical protein